MGRKKYAKPAPKKPSDKPSERLSDRAPGKARVFAPGEKDYDPDPPRPRGFRVEEK
jgi:hypothetical protein